jgi:S-(hydroxymethyl)glutathione dehydrogenase/alcohol dehydrogenase
MTDPIAVRAVVLRRQGEQVAIEELLLDPPGHSEVLVRILASGVCRSDLHVRDGDWPRPTPVVVGHEGAGIVEAVGAGVAAPRVGELVVLSWYAPCLRCAACRVGRQWLCSGSSSGTHRLPGGRAPFRDPAGGEVLGYLGIGTMAERVVVAAEAAVAVPAAIDPASAALIGCAVSTGVGAVIRTADVPAGAAVAVIGLGGVGLSVVMGAALAGADPIVAVDRDAAKLSLAAELGATATVLSTDAEATAEATAEAIRDATGGGPEFAFEAVGLAATAELAIATLRPGGTAVLVGIPAVGDRASFAVYPFVDGGRRIVGSDYGSTVASRDFPLYARMCLDGRLPVGRLVEERIAMDAAEDALAALRRGEGARRVIVP